VTQAEKADRLLALHRAPPILVLPNAWDVSSALVIAALPGCGAIATTSSGVAATLGYADGERIPPDLMLGAVERIARAVDVPVTADLESGYGDASRTAEAALAVGVVGLNLEDGHDRRDPPLVTVERHVEEIRAVREVARAAGVHLVVNARTDVYLRAVGDPDGRFEEAVARANAYLAAGADCAFVPGVVDAETIGRLAEAIDGPMNVLAVAATPPVPELERLGVARVSVGSWTMRASLGAARDVARELLEEGSYTRLAEHALSYPDLLALLGARE
jgi:2-methylisocitrate lyase-like PEP mutase family enzyme